MQKIFIYLWTVLFISACKQNNSSFTEKTQTSPINKQTLKIATTPTLDALPLWVAQQQGLFKKNKANVALQLFQADMDCDTAFVGVTADGMTTDLIRTEMLRRRKIDVTLFSATNAYWLLVANKKARLRQTNQFADKMIAIARFSATDYLTDKTFEKVRLKAPFFKIQINNVFIRRDMLQNNEMDAGWLKEPLATSLTRLHHVVVADSRTEKINLGVLAFNTKKINTPQKQRQLKLFTKAYNEACDSLNKFGVQHYANILTQYYTCDAKTIKALPQISYKKISAVSNKDKEIAQKYKP